MAQKNIRDAINDTLRLEMRRDPTVVVIGEDVVGGLGGSSGVAEAAGGTFGVTAGLAAEFGRRRVIDTPITMIAFTFWFTKFDNNVTILQALTDTGRYPITVYPWWLRVIVTYIVPIGLATTVPVQALRGELTGWNVLVFLSVSAVALFICLTSMEDGGQTV